MQVAAELLTRMDPPPTPEPALGEMQRMTYRIPQRTVDLIEELAGTSYNNDRAQVFAAGIKAIRMRVEIARKIFVNSEMRKSRGME